MAIIYNTIIFFYLLNFTPLLGPDTIGASDSTSHSESLKCIRIVWGIIKTHVFIPLGVLPVGQVTSDSMICIRIICGIVKTKTFCNFPGGFFVIELH